MAKIKFDKLQEQVINHKDGVAVVMAGAGSGKSTTLVTRVQRLIELGENEEDISITSFGSDSAKDLKRKLFKKGVRKATMGTFHAMCEKILLNEGIDTKKKIPIYEAENVFNNIYIKIENKKLTKGQTKDILSFIGYQKNNMISYNDTFIDKDSKFDESLLRLFFKAYELEKRKKKMYDWDDELLECYNILLKNPNKYTYKYILVDEAQDNNLVQNKLIKLLCPSENIMVVGDYRQAIYKFRGADPSLFMNFNKQYPNAKIMKLDYNYRSTKNIVENANNFIKKYYGGYELYSDSIPHSKENGKIECLTYYDKEEEAIDIVSKIEKDLKNGIKPNDIAILYRNNQNSFNVEKELKNKNIPYFINCEDGKFFNRKEIKCIMCMLRLINNPHDNEAFRTILETRTYPVTYMKSNVHEKIIEKSASTNMSHYEASKYITTGNPKDKINLNIVREMIINLTSQYKKGVKLGDLINNIITLLKMEVYIRINYDEEKQQERFDSLNALKSFIRDNTLESFLKFVYESSKSNKKCEKDEVQLMTVHKSKGLEFKKVYLISVEEGKFPSIKSPIDEEARLFYVAITRSKEDLSISQIGYDNLFVNQYFESSNEVHNEQQTKQAS